jgi:hypothetical protein
MQKTDLKMSTRRTQTQIFSIQVRRLRVFARRLRGLKIPRGSAFYVEALRYGDAQRFRVLRGGSVVWRFPEVPRFSRKLRAVQKQQHEPRKNWSKLDQNNSY